ncbi:hypothetical protein GOP47_0018675, partial [Adiantum capillus-veneris]
RSDFANNSYKGDLAAATQATNAGYLKLERIAKAKSRKMKKKMEAGLLQSAIMVANGPNPKQINEHQERGIFRVPPSLVPQESESCSPIKCHVMGVGQPCLQGHVE